MIKSMKYVVQLYLFPFLISLYARLIYLTNKTTFYHPKEIPSKAFILSMWHGNLFMQPFNYNKFKKKGNIKVIVSDHRDGKTIRKVIKYLGIGSIVGSSTRGGVKALVNAIKTINEGVDVAITPDGPKGPKYQVANGIVAIAQKTGCDILTCKVIASKYWQFNSWDNFMVPKLFGKIDFYIGEPFNVNGYEQNVAKEIIKNEMNK